VILRPESVEQTQKCLRIANQCGTPLYPVSRGYNWGLGSKVPVETECSLLDLSRMNRILEFDDELGYLVVEPGVSFTQAAEFLQKHNAKHFLSVIGGPPDASIIGNLVDRGDGLGPLGNRAEHVCSLEVVLGSGEIVKTGFSRFPNSNVSHIHRLGVGPSLDGLFTQSSLGIVTKATIWLNPTPANFQAFFFCLKNLSQFGEVVPRIRELQQQHITLPSSSFLWSAVKAVAVLGQHPSPESGEFDVDEMLRRVSPGMAGAAWVGGGALYAASSRMAAEQRRLVKRALSNACFKLTFLDSRRYRLAKIANRIKMAFGGKPLVDPVVLDAMFAKPTYLGYPTRRSLRSLYWRKQIPVPEKIDPHQDRCGLLWVCHIVPYTSEAMTVAARAAEEIVLEYGFEPNVNFALMSERSSNMAVQIIWDRDRPDDDEQALACHRQLEDRLNDLGFTSSRLVINSMAALPDSDSATNTLYGSLKTLCDPNSILAPGRYLREDQCKI